MERLNCRLQGGVGWLTVVTLVLAAALGVLPQPGYGACTLSAPSQWNVTSGNWSVAGNWSPSGVPNSSSANVCLTNGPATTTLDISASVADLQIGSSNTLAVGGNTLTVFGTSIANAGSITSNDGNLTLAHNVTLSGGGTITTSSDVFINQASGGLTLTNVDDTIQGTGQYGQNGLAIDNESGGTISASGGTLSLNGGGTVTNAGLLGAVTGGNLEIDNTVNNAGGNITADGGTVTVNNTINGGTLNQINGGTLTSSAATLNGVTLSTGSTYNVGGQTFLEGTITNNGTITVPNNTLTIAGGPVTLTGGGVVQMSSDAFFNQASVGLTLNNVNNTIEGTGQLGQNGMALNNEAGGVVNANVSSGTLSLNGGGTVANAGLLEATTGGGLEIDNTVDNAGGNITADGGTVTVNNTINGGTLNQINGGTLTSSTATLNGVTLSTGSTYNVGGQTFLEGTITNNGTITVPHNTLTVAGGAVTLQGGGTIEMSSDAFFNQASVGLTLNNVNNTIEGTGQLGQNGLTINNETNGTVLASVSGGTLSVNGGGNVTNTGTFEAAAGSTLLVSNPISSSTYSGGTLLTGTYDANGTIQIDKLSSTGGEITTNAANIILDGSLGGAAAIVDASGLNALTNLTNNQGSLTLANGGNANLTTVATATALANSGTVSVGSGNTLSVGAGLGIYAQSAGTTTVNGTLNAAGGVIITGGTLYGTGTVNTSSALIGSGATVRPGSAAAPGTLTVSGNTTINGTFAEQIASASNFSVLNLTGGNLTLGSGSQLNISLLSGFDPAGDTFTIMNAAGLSGTFSNAPAAGFAMDGYNWTIAYNSSDVVLNGVSAVGSLITATWNKPSGNWTTAAEWSCSPGPSSCVPNNSGSNVYAAVANSAGNTLTLNTSETVNTLSLQAGRLDITSIGSLNLAAQPNGITDIGAGAALSLEGSLTDSNGNALANLASIEGTLSLGNGQTTTLGAGLAISNSGVLTVTSPSTLLGVDGGLVNGGTVGVTNSGNLNITADVTNSGSFADDSAVTVGGIFSNSGTANVSGGATLQVNGLGGYSQTSGSTTVSGTLMAAKLDVEGGTFTNDTGVTNLGGATGTTPGSINIASGSSLTDNASITDGSASTPGSVVNGGTVLVGAGAMLTVDDGGTYTQSGGSTTIDGGMLVPAVQLNGGTLSVNTGGTVQGTTYTQSGGTTKLDGTLLVPAVQLSGGTLTGIGTVKGSVSNTGGTLDPGDEPGTGTLAITGNYTQGALGTFVTDIAGGSTGDFDVLDVAGAATLDGTLNINLPDGFGFLTNGEEFIVLDAAGGLSGTFSTVDGLDFGSGDSWTVAYGADTVALTANIAGSPAAPEPASWLLTGLAVVALGWTLRRNRTTASA